MVFLGDRYVYRPRLKAQEEFESLWEIERRASQAVWQRLALLEQKSRQLDTKRKSTALSISTTERLQLFADLQEARASLLDILTSSNTSIARSMNHAQAVDFLRRLDAIEAIHCTKLSFRRTALSWTERARCFACFCIYLLYFKILPFLFPSDGVWTPQFYHAVSTIIMDLLDIPCSMEMGPNWMDELYKASEALNPSSSSTLTSSSHRVKLLLPTQHWVEEVGFWACDNNPLLAVSPWDLQGSERMSLRICTGPSVTYDWWWRQHFDRFPAVRQYMASVRKPWRMGYPLVPSSETITVQSDLPEKNDDADSITSVPVAIAGLPGICDPDLNTINVENTAVKRKRTYDYVVEQQFVKDHSSMENDASKDVASNDQLRGEIIEVEEEGSQFLLSIFKYGVSVHGDTSTAHCKKIAPPSLKYYLGKVCCDENSLIKEMLHSWKVAVES